MDKSLEDIIKERNAEKKSKFQDKPKNVNRDKRKASAEPLNFVQKTHFVEKKQHQPQQNHSSAAAVPSNILSRLGSKTGSATVGTSVSMSNLNQEVTLTDLTELCGSVGEVLSASFLPSGGKGKKQALVAFARRSDAVSFVNKFNNLTLDGTPMSIKLTDGALATEFASFAGTQSGQKNSKASMFGSALRQPSGVAAYEDDDEPQPQPRFTVTMKQEPAFSRPGGNARPGGFKGRGGGGGGGRGGGRGGGGFNKDRKPDVSADDLDNALASYLNGRSKND